MIPYRLLFYGPKGCGKSHFAKCFFGELEKSIPRWMTVELKKSAILRNPDKNIEELFVKIRDFKIQGILIEDLNILLDDLAEFKSARNTLLENIRAINGNHILIATTRNPNNIDEKILIDFDDVIPFYYQNREARLDILRVHSEIIRKVKFDRSVDLNKIVDQTEWFSGKELEDLIVSAQQKSNTNIVNREDILDALDIIKNRIIIENRIREMKTLLSFTLKYCTLKSVKNELLADIKNLNIDFSLEKSKDIKLDWNKILELKPNFFGFGINLNELVDKCRTYFGKKSKKT